MAINTKHAWLSSAILAVAAVLRCGQLSGEEVGTNMLIGTIGDSPGLVLTLSDDLELAEQLAGFNACRRVPPFDRSPGRSGGQCRLRPDGSDGWREKDGMGDHFAKARPR